MMSRRTRMFCTLAVASVAMTGAAAVLSYFDPYPDDRFTPDAATRLARTLIREDVVVDSVKWKGIEIIEGPQSHPGLTLSAGADPTESHFYVDDRGRLSRSSRWRKQLSPAAAPDMIRIRVTPQLRAQGLSPAQWYAIQALLDGIDETLRSTGRTLPIYASEDFRQVQFFTPVSKSNSVSSISAG